MITAVRVDERLIHGQVAMTWTKSLNLNGLIVANDDAASNEIQQMTLKMATPSDVKTIIRNVESTIEFLKDPRISEMNIMVLVSTIKDAVRLAEAFPKEISLMNIGNVGKMKKHNEETTTLSKEVILTNSEKEALKTLVEIYPETSFQPTPAMEKKLAISILNKFN